MSNRHQSRYLCRARISKSGYEIKLYRMTRRMCKPKKMDGLRIQTNLVEFACHLGRNRFSVPVTTVFPVGIF